MEVSDDIRATRCRVSIAALGAWPGNRTQEITWRHHTWTDFLAAALLEFVNEEVERRTVAHGTVELGCVYLGTPLTPITTGQRVRVISEDNDGK